MKRLWTLKSVVAPAGAAFVIFGMPLTYAQDATAVSIALKDHRFVPPELTVPANKPVVIEVTNQDSTPSEFESKTLRVEKVVTGGAKISVQIRALAPGRYRFFDDYHEDTTEGLCSAT
jgi:heme/copper-type cytochrome/quinol oxidase subunit 2